MELLFLGLVVISSLLGIGFGGRSERGLVQALALIGLSCAILGAAGFVVLVYGLPVPVHPYGLALLVFILAAAAGTLLPFALIGLWLQRERHHSVRGVVFLILGFSLFGSREASAQQQEETLLPPVPWAGFATRAPFDQEDNSRLSPSFPSTSTVITSPSGEFDTETLGSIGELRLRLGWSIHRWGNRGHPTCLFCSVLRRSGRIRRLASPWNPRRHRRFLGRPPLRLSNVVRSSTQPRTRFPKSPALRILTTTGASWKNFSRAVLTEQFDVMNPVLAQ